MRVTVRLLTAMKKYHPAPNSGDSWELTLSDGSTVQNLLDKLNIPAKVPKTVLVNRIHAQFKDSLRDGDVISILQPVAGG